MNTLRISTAGKALLRSASKIAIENYFNSMPAGRRRLRWLKQNNPYRVRCTQQYDKDLKVGSVQHAELIGYVAASGPAHVVDGWSLVSRAIDAALKGDNYAAVHFGYYAELRAAASLLACEGVGIFNTKHPIVESTVLTRPMPNGEKLNPATNTWARGRDLSTHSIVWLALQHWAGRRSSADLIHHCIQPDGIALTEWLDAAGHPVSFGPIAKMWLTKWGLDLSLLEDDHNSRNLVSYRPSEFRTPPALPTEELIEFVEDLWRMFEPGNARRFPTLERHLLRRTLRTTGGVMPDRAALETIGLEAAKAIDWVAFFAQPNELLPLRYAEMNSSVEDPRCHLQIISRAALLLYLATMASRRVLSRASYTTETLRFWWERHGTKRGLWDETSKPDEPADLWADVEADINDSRTWRESLPQPASLRTFRRDQLPKLDRVVDFELAGIWGLLP